MAIGDDGVELDHRDLAANSGGNPHYNFYTDSADGSPPSGEAVHATAVAGLIGAQGDNEQGVVGVAPRARLASWVIFGTSFFGRESFASDEQLMDMYQFALDQVAVQNHSWGSVIPQFPPDALSESGIANAIENGRGGKGVVMVRAAGNSRDFQGNANDDPFASDPRVIAVAAVRKDGRVCSYSSPGASVLVAAPSGDLAEDPAALDVLTTDRSGAAGYNSDDSEAGDFTPFNGTSASSPQVAGVAALILSANTNLTSRDVQQILIHSARHADLNDPDARPNGAGFRVSHNVGFGIPDAGMAVRLAQSWSNRPPAATVTLTNTSTQDIPDDALRLVCEAPGLSGALSSIRCLPSQGPHADSPTRTLPLVYVGQANDPLTEDLRGKAALIQRGVTFFTDKIARAAAAGAEFAVVFNNVGTTELLFMAGTAFTPIPAVLIGKNDGEALRDFIALGANPVARLQLTPATSTFAVTNSLITEHVGVRLKTTHSSRSDVRVTLLSPMGTRSVLQALNNDGFEGPSDWTYWSVQHFYESSAGQWRVEVSDQDDTTLRLFPDEGTPATGAVTYAELILKGVSITDSDRDGLDDAWEQRHFASLAPQPAEDPDQDGFNNAREQIMGSNPAVANEEFRLNLAQFQDGHWRLSWPSRETARYSILSADSVTGPWTELGSVERRFPVAEWIVPSQASRRLYRIFAEENP